MDTYESLIEGMLADGYGLAEGFLSPSEVTALAAQLHHRQADGQFHPAGTGNHTATVETRNRGDNIHWLERSGAVAAETAFLDRMDGLMAYLNQTCYLGLRDHEFHYANYPAGTHYARHRDRFRADSRRELSVVCYLNTDWLPTDGGQLDLYLTNAAGTEHTEQIAPLGGRLVCFESSRLEHEVLTATRERLSLTGWFRTD
jgi:SM-20-related protein